MKEKIKPIYLQLQGYLTNLPEVGNDYEVIKNKQTWEVYHETIDELSEITGESYDNFKLKIEINDNNFNKKYGCVNLNNFRFQLGGLILRLYGKYFSDEKNPLDVSSSPITNISQNQNQLVNIEIAIEMTELITKKLLEHGEGTVERNFLEKVKEGLRSGRNIVELINLILVTGANLGLSIDNILKILSK